ncbi:MAG TPA: hypothetical protein VKU19_22260 [Bryobacteraceae bacterium]|nr:hypothetical protein [Bryobacteraceae bacterium]
MILCFLRAGCENDAAVAASFESLGKWELHDLADGLILRPATAVEECIQFVVAETRGLWHGRARAMMCRRLKHCELTKEQQSRLVDAVLDRLASGRFSEQFYDQLGFVLHADPQRAFAAARKNLEAAGTKTHVRKYSEWVLAHEKPAGS